MKTGEEQNVTNESTPKTVAQIWTEVLQRDDIGLNQNFFDLGGDSLKALEVISRLHALLGVELPLIAFFEDPTIAHLTEVVAALQPATHRRLGPAPHGHRRASQSLPQCT